MCSVLFYAIFRTFFDSTRSTRAPGTEVADFVTFPDRLRLIDQCFTITYDASPRSTTRCGSFDVGALLLAFAFAASGTSVCSLNRRMLSIIA